MADKLKWGIISTGRIAGEFARGLAVSRTGTLVAVASRTQEAADKFGGQYGIAKRFSSYQAMLDDPEVQAVYIATPHPMHAEWAIRAADAGKHVLCEKPLTINYAEAMAVIEAARRNDVFLMEAFMYRCHPQTARLVELVRSKVIGDVILITAAFSFRSGPNPEGRLFKNALGGGGIMDVGCYATSVARLIAGAALGMDVAEPIEVMGMAKLNEVTGTDDYAVGLLKFPGGILAEISTGVRLNQENCVRIFGSDGWIHVPSPWGLGGKGGTSKIFVHKSGGTEEISVSSDVGSYTLEADAVGDHVAKRQAPSPAMTWADSLGNMRTLDRWRTAIGLTFDIEKHEHQTRPASGRPLAVRKGNTMKYLSLPGLKKKVSRLVMGIQGPLANAMVMYDDFVERGGNCFDSAYIYGAGRGDKDLGHWIKTRGVRDDMVILAKGAHTPHCNPAALTKQLLESLDRLQTGHVDIYMMHRDNIEIPVGEFIDVLNEHVRAGRITVFGGSNWSIPRIEEANAYAKAKGLMGFAAISNNFSLARMVEAPWGGCLASSDAESRAWFTKTGTPLMPWSSQGQGFFTGRFSADDRSNTEVVRCWYADDNFRRLARAGEMAEKRKVDTTNIALAYVLNQPFPTMPLVGPRTIDETRSCMQALEIVLSPDEMAWLNLEKD